MNEFDCEKLAREHTGWMLGVALRLVKERSVAEDVVQEAWVAAFRALPSFRGESKIKTWLYRITVNAALNHLRTTQRRAEVPIDDLAPQFDDQGCRIEAPWPQLNPVETYLENERLRGLLISKLAELPQSYREVFRLRLVEGLDTREVAELLNLSEANVKVRLHRARAALKTLLEPMLRGDEQ
ncbi:MAG: sigma-70 family RNA polymerase sigma factor [Gammaproteobacteria bacterium]|nr:sigma-70 family RNA polymerase sigma factor [Gammaproteobacteria bacterium]